MPNLGFLNISLVLIKVLKSPTKINFYFFWTSKDQSEWPFVLQSLLKRVLLFMKVLTCLCDFNTSIFLPLVVLPWVEFPVKCQIYKRTVYSKEKEYFQTSFFVLLLVKNSGPVYRGTNWYLEVPQHDHLGPSENMTQI